MTACTLVTLSWKTLVNDYCTHLRFSTPELETYSARGDFIKAGRRGTKVLLHSKFREGCKNIGNNILTQDCTF